VLPALLARMRYRFKLLPHNIVQVAHIKTPDMTALRAPHSQHRDRRNVDLCRIMTARQASNGK
jgi:hypothetical protein